MGLTDAKKRNLKRLQKGKQKDKKEGPAAVATRSGEE